MQGFLCYCIFARVFGPDLLKVLARWHKPFCALLVHLGLHINFPSLYFVSLSTCTFRTMLGCNRHVSIFAFWQMSWDTADSLLQRQPVTVCQIMSFLGKVTFCDNGHAQHNWLYHVIQSDMLNVFPFSSFISFTSLLILFQQTYLPFFSVKAICHEEDWFQIGTFFLTYWSMSVLLHLRKFPISGSLGVECFQPSFRWDMCVLLQHWFV